MLYVTPLEQHLIERHRDRMIRSLFLFFSFVLAGCGSTPIDCVAPLRGDVVYVVSQGWHTEIGIPIEELDKNMRFFQKVFPGAEVLMFGYGKKTFFTAPAQSWNEYLLGPLPGPAVIHVVGLRVTPREAYPPDSTETLLLPPGGGRAVSAYIWKDLLLKADQKPQEVVRSTNPDGMFYASRSQYNLFHTCNTWTVDVLQAGGLDVSSDNVIFSGQASSHIDDAALEKCRIIGDK